MRTSLIIASLALGGGLLASAPAMAQAGNNYRTRTVVVFGNDECPKSTNPDEVVVCARRPEEERYRIPKTLREEEKAARKEDNVPAQRAALVDPRPGGSGVGSCSSTGAGGMMGCNKGLDVVNAGRVIVEGVRQATEPTEDPQN